MGFVYAIVHNPMARKYVGSTVRLKQRKRRHFSDLRKGRHFNSYLQRTFSKYGESDFCFVVLKECDEISLPSKANNKSGCVGVYLHECGKWRAEIVKDGKYIGLGYHTCKENAVAARKKAEGVCHRI